MLPSCPHIYPIPILLTYGSTRPPPLTTVGCDGRVDAVVQTRINQIRASMTSGKSFTDDLAGQGEGGLAFCAGDVGCVGGEVGLSSLRLSVLLSLSLSLPVRKLLEESV